MIPGEQKLVQCCGYTCATGRRIVWECPGCHRIHEIDPEPGQPDAGEKKP